MNDEHLKETLLLEIFLIRQFKVYEFNLKGGKIRSTNERDSSDLQPSHRLNVNHLLIRP